MLSDRTTETEISEAVLQILAEVPDGEAPLDRIKELIPEFIKLTDADRAQSDTRPNEELWEQLVRNIVSHKETEGNYIAEGFLESPRRGWLRITDSGRRRVS